MRRARSKVDAEGKPIPDALGEPLDPLGFLGRTALGDALRPGHIHWLSLFGVLGIFVAFGHSILAMSGEETLAQVYREVESPKLLNFKKAALVVFVYSLLLTSLISFFAVMIIPDDVRLSQYSGNLIGGLAMNVIGPTWAKLALNALVVGVGFLILSGAVNTAIVGSNGVLNRVSEDGVMPDWFLKPHPAVRHDLPAPEPGRRAPDLHHRGEPGARCSPWARPTPSAWSGASSSRRWRCSCSGSSEPGGREYEVPLNIRVGKFDVPLGIGLIFLVLFFSAVVNFATKEVATVSGVIFTVALFVAFSVSERAHVKRTGVAADHHEHLEQFNQARAEEVSPACAGDHQAVPQAGRDPLAP